MARLLDLAPSLLVTAATCLGQERSFVTHERLVLGPGEQRSAGVRLADLDGDGDLDAVVANGRHWPEQNLVLLQQGRARFGVERPLGLDRATSYAAEVADLDGDGHLDIAVGNDLAPNEVLLGDGAGGFTHHGTFGSPASLRSLTLADVDLDGDVDILACVRGASNRIHLNDGTGRFEETVPFGDAQESTLGVAVADLNRDGHPDLVLANRDAQPNAVLLGEGGARFTRRVPFGTGRDESRAVAVADLDGDGQLDWVTGNIGQPNALHLGDGAGGVRETVELGRADGRTYALALADMDLDGDLDVVVGNAGQEGAVHLNGGDGRSWSEVRFGEPGRVTYGLAVGDLNGDGFPDIASANSGAVNSIHLSAPLRSPGHWPAFRGPGGAGVAEGHPLPTSWNAEPGGEEQGVLWRAPVPGLGHSSPVVWGQRVFLCTAVPEGDEAELMLGAGGQPTAADDAREHSWLVLCFDKATGEELWRRTARRGIPRVTRHVKATQANTSLVVDGEHLVAFFGSEGLYCYDLDGNLEWQRDLGVIDISKYGIGWGYASSPALHGDRIAIVCDDPSGPYVAVLSLDDGEELWRMPREGISERSWGTPLVHADPGGTQVVVNGWPVVVSYDLETGEELWRIEGGGDNPIPTPFVAGGLIYIASSHGRLSPIYAVRPGARGNITPSRDEPSNDGVAWSRFKGGSYMSTPVVYRGRIYLGTSSIVRCFDARTGEPVFQERLGEGASIIASLVAGDGKVYCTSEDGVVHVLAAGPELEVLARNAMGEACFATPALSEGVLLVRTTGSLVAIR